MKKSLTLLALTMACSMNAQIQIYQTNISGSTTSSAIGSYTKATATGAFASGKDTEATGDYSQALGYRAKAYGDKSFAIGDLTTANGINSTAMGYWTEANGDYSTSTGEFSDANGKTSTAMGYGSYASDAFSLVIGHNNLSGSTVTGSATEFNSANTAFVIGNGSWPWDRSDAFKVMSNGDTTVSNDLTVNGDIVVSSDARLKANIVSLGSTLAKLLLIYGKTYTMKKNGKQKIGVLAQDIQKVFPELVTTDDKDMLAVNYQGLVPVLINALKEQDDKISRLEKLVEKLISDN